MFFMGRRKDGLWLKLKLVGKVIFFFKESIISMKYFTN